jgi:tRNA-splicing ligase RtcB
MHWSRQAIEKTLKMSPGDLSMSLVYDVAHNIAKIEEHIVDGRRVKVCVHRKGATRAFPAGHPEVSPAYQKIGQPVFIPGDMGRASFVLVGTDLAMKETFGSSCHGAGRALSRSEARRRVDFDALMKDLARQGVVVMAEGRGTVVEEAPIAYKDVNRVVDVVTRAGIARKVARLRPIGVVKG